MLNGSRPIKFSGTPTVAPSAASGADPGVNGSAWGGGTFSTILSSASEDMLLTRIFFTTQGTVATEWELHIAFGAAASEVVKLVIPAGNDTTSGQIININLPRPLFVPSGTRISCRTSSLSTSGSACRPNNVKIALMPAAAFLPD